MDSTNILMFVAVVAVVVAGVNIIAVTSILPTGYATENDTGYAQLEISESLDIAFSVDTIDWGAGYVDASSSFATLNSEGTNTNASATTNWADNPVNQGLVLQNIGNVDANVSLVTDDNATDFICGSAGCSNPEYQWKFTEITAGACTVQQSLAWGTYRDVCKQGDSSCDIVGSGDGMAVCDGFLKVDGTTTYDFEIDVQVVIPSDAEPEEKSATIIAGAEKAYP